MGASVQIIEDNSLKVVDDGFEIGVRLNWYRSLPVSCIENLKLSVDGQPVPSEQITFGINGHAFRLDELNDLVEEFWFVQDSARLHVHQSGKIASGESHAVEAEIALRFPYIAIGPGKFLTNPTRCIQTMIAHS
jgi:hypothetical protein